MLFGRKNSKLLELELLGLTFANPVGVMSPAGAEESKTKAVLAANPGFLTLNAPKEHILPWIMGLQSMRKRTVLAVNLRHSIERSFSLVYDFADLIIVDPEASHTGIGEPDLSDTTSLLDELINLRLCYEHYTPIFLRLYEGLTPDEVTPLLSYCRLSGIDGLVAPSLRICAQLSNLSQGRVPIIGATSSSYEDALSMLQAGIPLVETQLRPLQQAKLISTLQKQAKTKHD